MNAHRQGCADSVHTLGGLAHEIEIFGRSRVRCPLSLVNLLEMLLSFLVKLRRTLREAIMPDILIPSITNDPSKVQLLRIAYIYFEHPDLDKFAKFALNFSFIEEYRTKDTI